MEEGNDQQTFQERNRFGIRVALRVRPLTDSADRARDKAVLQYSDRGQVTVENGSMSRTFKFDVSFDSEASQSEVFEQCGVTRLMELAVEGYSCTCFAYGQTSSGKTHTMTGPPQEFLTKPQPDPENFGILPRSFLYLFDLLAANKLSSRVRVSYYEIYNEQLVDLLNPRSVYPLNVRWKQGRGFFVENLFVIECESANDLMGVLETGMRNRAFNPTHPNEFSSRSHSIFNILIDTDVVDEETNLSFIKHGRISFVDLAGSEKAKDGVDMSPEQLMETQTINRSLLVLGNCINALADPKKKSSHIPIRDSKLTKLLCDSLGGNGVALMIACVSPSSTSITETMSTLRYASRARQIENAPQIQLDPREQLIKDLKSEINALKRENKYLRGNKNLKKNNEKPMEEDPIAVRSMASIASQTESVFISTDPPPSPPPLPVEMQPTQPEPTSLSSTESQTDPLTKADISKSNSQVVISLDQGNSTGLYEMLQEFMAENEGLKSENSSLHRFKSTTIREQEELARENDVLARRVDQLERMLWQLQSDRIIQQQEPRYPSEKEYAAIERGYPYMTRIVYPIHPMHSTFDNNHHFQPREQQQQQQYSVAAAYAPPPVAALIPREMNWPRRRGDSAGSLKHFVDHSGATYIIDRTQSIPTADANDEEVMSWQGSANNTHPNAALTSTLHREENPERPRITARREVPPVVVPAAQLPLPVRNNLQPVMKVTYERNYENRKRVPPNPTVDRSAVAKERSLPAGRKAPLPSIRNPTSQDYEEVNDRLKKELAELDGVIHRQNKVNSLGQQMTYKTNRL